MPLDLSALTQVAAGVVPPALAAGAALACARALGRARAGPPLALGLAAFAGFVGTHGWPGDPRHADVKEALAWSAPALALAAALLERERAAALARVGAAFALAFALAWYELDFVRAYRWKGAAAWIGCAALAAAAMLAATLLGRLARRRGAAAARELGLGQALASALAAGALLLGSSASLGQLSGAVAVGATAVALLGRSFGPGAALAAVLLHHGLLWAGHFAAELPVAAAALAGASPLGAWLGELQGRDSRARRWVGWLGVTLLGGVACWIAAAARSSDPYAF